MFRMRGSLGMKATISLLGCKEKKGKKRVVLGAAGGFTSMHVDLAFLSVPPLFLSFDSFEYTIIINCSYYPIEFPPCYYHSYVCGSL
jgi:hypothetical protein